MLVKGKGRDIAILRTMGATRAMICACSYLRRQHRRDRDLAGFGLGLAFADNIETIRQWIQGLTGTELFAAEIYFLSQLPAIVDMGEVDPVVPMGWPVVPGDALSVLAGGAARSGGSAALW